MDDLAAKFCVFCGGKPNTGQGVLSRQRELGWSETVVATLARDFQPAFPGTSRFSPRNLGEMRRFVEAFSEPEIQRHAVVELGRFGLGRGSGPITSSVLKILRQRVAESHWATC